MRMQPALPSGVRPAAGRVRRPHDARPDRGRREDRAGPRAGRPLRERRLPRRQGRAGPHGGPHPPARAPARERRDHRVARAPASSAPGTIVTIVYEGDADDDAERYLVGHIEEKRRATSTSSARPSPLGAALIGAAAATGSLRGPNGELRVQGPRGRGWSSLTARSTLEADDRRPRRRRSSHRLPPGATVELPGRGHRRSSATIAGPPGAPDGRAAPRLDGDAPTSTGSVLRAARRALPGGRLRPSRPRPRHPHRAGRSGSRTAPTTPWRR